jgi:hypothetical protein
MKQIWEDVKERWPMAVLGALFVFFMVFVEF